MKQRDMLCCMGCTCSGHVHVKACPAAHPALNTCVLAAEGKSSAAGEDKGDREGGTEHLLLRGEPVGGTAFPACAVSGQSGCAPPHCARALALSRARVYMYPQLCHKQYKTAMELETHLSSYDHHHKKVTRCCALDA